MRSMPPSKRKPVANTRPVPTLTPVPFCRELLTASRWTRRVARLVAPPRTPLATLTRVRRTREARSLVELLLDATPNRGPAWVPTHVRPRVDRLLRLARAPPTSPLRRRNALLRLLSSAADDSDALLTTLLAWTLALLEAE